MTKFFYISNIMYIFAAYKKEADKTYDRGRVNQRNTAEKVTLGAGWKAGSGI